MSVAEKNKRENQRAVSSDAAKDFSISIRDIDEAIHYYFKNVIKPTVQQNGTRIQVPIIYGNPERWATIQRGDIFRDKNGMIQPPLIIYKRDSLEKVRNISNKLDANNPHNFGVVEVGYSQKNPYDKFSILTNRKPVKEYQAVVVPDYVNITYSCIILTQYVEQMNKIVEAINYASDSYWGNPNKFSFRARIDTYTTTTELVEGKDRMVKTDFIINLSGYIVPDTINTQTLSDRKFYSRSSIKFGLEAVSDLSGNVNTVENNKNIVSPTSYFETEKKVVQTIITPMTQEEITYLSASKVYSSNTTAISVDGTGRILTWKNLTMLTPPSNFPALTKTDFQIYVNGMAVEFDAINEIRQLGKNVVVVFNTSLGYTISSSDEFNIIGKFK